MCQKRTTASRYKQVVVVACKKVVHFFSVVVSTTVEQGKLPVQKTEKCRNYYLNLMQSHSICYYFNLLLLLFERRGRGPSAPCGRLCCGGQPRSWPELGGALGSYAKTKVTKSCLCIWGSLSVFTPLSFSH